MSFIGFLDGATIYVKTRDQTSLQYSRFIRDHNNTFGRLDNAKALDCQGHFLAILTQFITLIFLQFKVGHNTPHQNFS